MEKICESNDCKSKTRWFNRKLNKPVIAHQPEGYTSHFRDPKVFKHHEEYYAILGVQTQQELGRLLCTK